MKKRILVAAFMVLTAIALSIPNRLAFAQSRFCANCATQCWNEANTGANNQAYWRCRDSGGSQEYCDREITEKYYNNCVTFFCNYNGCTIPLIY